MVWTRRLVPMLAGAGLLYLGWRLATINATPVDVDFLLGRLHEVALWKVLAAAVAAGAATVGVFTLYQMARGGLITRRYRKQLAGLEAEIHQLRNLPLAPEEAASRGDVEVGVRGLPEGSNT